MNTRGLLLLTSVLMLAACGQREEPPVASRTDWVLESHVKFLESAERDFHADDTDLPSDLATAARPAAAPAARPVTEERARPSNLFEALASGTPAAPAGAAPAAPAGPPASDVLPGISDILDRLSQGQRETLASMPPRREAANPPSSRDPR